MLDFTVEKDQPVVYLVIGDRPTRDTRERCLKKASDVTKNGTRRLTRSANMET